jgi:hypothetical protein
MLNVFMLNRAVVVSDAVLLLAHRLFHLNPKKFLKTASGFPSSGAVAAVYGALD